MSLKFTNNAAATLTAPISPADTSFSVSNGNVFPTTNDGYFYATIVEGGQIEVIRVSVRAGNLFSTVIRGLDGTTAQAFTTSANVYLRLPAIALNDVVPFGNEVFWMFT